MTHLSQSAAARVQSEPSSEVESQIDTLTVPTDTADLRDEAQRDSANQSDLFDDLVSRSVSLDDVLPRVSVDTSPSSVRFPDSHLKVNEYAGLPGRLSFELSHPETGEVLSIPVLNGRGYGPAVSLSMSEPQVHPDESISVDLVVYGLTSDTPGGTFNCSFEIDAFAKHVQEHGVPNTPLAPTLPDSKLMAVTAFHIHYSKNGELLSVEGVDGIQPKEEGRSPDDLRSSPTLDTAKLAEAIYQESTIEIVQRLQDLSKSVTPEALLEAATYFKESGVGNFLPAQAETHHRGNLGLGSALGRAVPRENRVEVARALVGETALDTANILDKAMRGLGTDEEAIIRSLESIAPTERRLAAIAYEMIYLAPDTRENDKLETLDDMLESEMGSRWSQDDLKRVRELLSEDSKNS